MRKSILLAALCMLTLPLFSSPHQSIEPIARTPFASVALAGHTGMGGWCECGSSAACFCDPGETPNGQSVSRNTQNQNELPASEIPEDGIDFGAATLMLVFFALTLSRLRG